ncbi:Anthrax toxin receptor-like [Manis javanica]|nr:Anthrax toxin receptor-like [Manis javanica]
MACSASRSRSVNDTWEFTQHFVQDLVNRFKNPTQRMSFITYSTHGHVNMQLTSDRKKINSALVELLHVLSTGAINMQHGLKKANEQIQRTRAAGQRVPSLIIVLTGGELLPESFAKTQAEAAKSRQLGATLYFVGVQDYQLSQLREIAGKADHMFGVDTGYSGLEDIIDRLIARSCVQITSVDYSTTCTRGKNEVKVIGKGFENTQKEDVICQFQIGKKTIRMKAVSVEDTSVTCPGPKLNDRGQAVFIDISLNNGLTFFKTDLDVSRRNCATSRCSVLRRRKGRTVIMWYYNDYKMTMQVNYHDVHLQMPVVDHPAVHCTNPAAIAPSSAAPAHGARVFNPVAAHLNNATHNCGSLDTLESRSVTLTP